MLFSSSCYNHNTVSEMCQVLETNRNFLLSMPRVRPESFTDHEKFRNPSDRMDQPSWEERLPTPIGVPAVVVLLKSLFS